MHPVQFHGETFLQPILGRNPGTAFFTSLKFSRKQFVYIEIFFNLQRD